LFFRRRCQLCRTTVTHGADLDHQDNEGKTTLIYTAYYGYEKLAEYLVLKGASVNLVDNRGYNSLDYVEMYSRAKTIEMLKAMGQSL